MLPFSPEKEYIFLNTFSSILSARPLVVTLIGGELASNVFRLLFRVFFKTYLRVSVQNIFTRGFCCAIVTLIESLGMENARGFLNRSSLLKKKNVMFFLFSTFSCKAMVRSRHLHVDKEYNMLHMVQYMFKRKEGKVRSTINCNKFVEKTRLTKYRPMKQKFKKKQRSVRLRQSVLPRSRLPGMKPPASHNER